MPRPASNAPAEQDILCEGCGYILSGLPETGNCPECGKPIAQSRGDHRQPSAFEADPSVRSLLRTVFAVLFRPARFFGSLTARERGTRAIWFARCHRFTAAALFSIAASGYVVANHIHYRWANHWPDEPVVFSRLLAPFALITYVMIAVITGLAARLTAQIAAQRGIRLQPDVVRRAFCFHSVHWVPAAFLIAATVGGPLSLQLTPLAVIFYVVVVRFTIWKVGGRGIGRPLRIWLGAPVAILMAVTVAGYFFLFDSPYFDEIAIWPSDRRPYFYALAAEAVLCLAYLLLTGWIDVKNMMYASDRGDQGMI